MIERYRQTDTPIIRNLFMKLWRLGNPSYTELMPSLSLKVDSAIEPERAYVPL